MSSSILIAVFLGIGVILYVGNLTRRQAQEKLPSTTPDAQQREKAANALWDLYPAFPDDEPETALFLLEESKKSYDGWIDTNARLESKATSLTSVLAGGAGILSVFGSQGPKGALQPGPYLFLALGAAVSAFLCCLYILRPKLRPHPGVSDYVAPSIALYSMARFHIMLSLAEGYNLAVLEIARLRRFDPVAWASAQTFLGLAVVALVSPLWSDRDGRKGEGDKYDTMCWPVRFLKARSDLENTLSGAIRWPISQNHPLRRRLRHRAIGCCTKAGRRRSVRSLPNRLRSRMSFDPVVGLHPKSGID